MNTKVVIVVLILLAVLFVAGVGMGVHFNGQGQSTCDENTAADKCADNCKTQSCLPGWTDSLGGIFGSLRPKLNLSDLNERDRQTLSSVIQPPATASLQVPEAPSSFFKPSMRTATLRLVKGVRAKIVFNASSPESVEKELRQQTLDLPRDKSSKDNDDLRQGSLAITKQGGVLSITCENNVPCQLELK
jgi:hypothetical protein